MSPWPHSLCALWGGVWLEGDQSGVFERIAATVGLLLPRFKAIQCNCHLEGDVEWVSGWSEDMCTSNPPKLDGLFRDVLCPKGFSPLCGQWEGLHM